MTRAPLSSDVADTRAMLDAAAAVHGAIEAYVAPCARITFADWIGRARAVASQFAKLGVDKGDVVALWLPSGIDYATCYAAAAMIGAITTGLNPRLGRRELELILQQVTSTARACVGTGTSKSTIRRKACGRQGFTPEARLIDDRELAPWENWMAKSPSLPELHAARVARTRSG